MSLSQTEIISVVAVLLYIMFFSHSPPTLVRSLLSNAYIAAGILAGIVYLTLWKNRTLGVLLILAFLLTMTRVTEHLDTGATPPPTEKPKETTPTSPTNTPPPPPPPASSTSPTVDGSSVPGMGASTPSTGTTMDTHGNIVDSTGKIVQAAMTPVTAAATSTPAPARAAAPPIVTPDSVSAPTAPAVSISTTSPAPVMSCNLESFASF